MKQMTLKEVQGVLLEIVKDIHTFCVNHNIEYTLAYGTLIGAIRHKGFIPWDDDIDIWMTRPNYECFIKEYQSEHYLIKRPEDSDNYLGYVRVYDINKTYSPENYRNLNKAAGVWVDILPLDGVSEDKATRNREYEIICRQRDLTSGYRTNIYEFRRGGLAVKIKNAAKLTVKQILRGSQQKLMKKYDSLCQRHPYGSTSLCANYYCYSAYTKRKIELLRTGWFKNYKLTEFDGVQLMITTEYDALLRSIFGDYMQLPPEDKRGGFHIGTFYWKY